MSGRVSRRVSEQVSARVITQDLLIKYDKQAGPLAPGVEGLAAHW